MAGMTAPQAAGVIHSDFEKGFIRAETVRTEIHRLLCDVFALRCQGGGPILLSLVFSPQFYTAEVFWACQGIIALP